MNLVLADTEEFRKIKKQSKPTAPGAAGSSAQAVVQEEKRTLGLTIVRGKNIVSLSVESPPPADPSARLGKSTAGGIASTLTGGPGVARPAGRGAPPPVALSVREIVGSIYWDIANWMCVGPGSWCWRWCAASWLRGLPRRSSWFPGSWWT